MTRINGHAPKRRRHQQPHHYTRPCPWCQGSGVRPYRGLPSPCYACKATGTLTTTFRPY